MLSARQRPWLSRLWGSIEFSGEPEALLPSFFLGGFECASHRRSDGQRLDLLSSTAHDRLASEDYTRLHSLGLKAARDGLRWHRVETGPRTYQWDSWVPMLRAARKAQVRVIWDLFHYGWPDDLDIWSGDFVDRFARYAAAAARVFREESDEIPMFCPINEISFLAWAGGQQGVMNPWGRGRGGELKRQLVRAFIAGVAAVRAVDSRARIIVSEPLINVISGGQSDIERHRAEAYRLAQFETHDMISGVMLPELGGSRQYLDVIGANFYSDNQWYLDGPTIPFGHHAYRALGDMLVEVQKRYARPILISETGAEGSVRPYWLGYVCGEVRRAIQQGAAIEGICLYPIVDYHGWENDRLCQVGLLSLPGVDGNRHIDAALAAELANQRRIMAQER